MKVAISVKNNNGVDSEVESRFGRAPFFAIVDTDSMETNFIENLAVNSASGAGVNAAQTIADQKVEAVISGNYGPKAYQGLKAANLQVYSFADGTLKEAIDSLKAGSLSEVKGPTHGSHAGLR